MMQLRSIRTVATVCGVFVSLAACGGGDADADADAVVEDTAQAAPLPDVPSQRGYPTELTGGVAGVLAAEGEGEMVAITVTDGDLVLSRDSIGGGPATVVIENKGSAAHTIEVFSEHYGRWRSAPIVAGGSGSISMPLTYATYEVFCTVAGHKEAGEVATLRVQ